MSAYGTCGEVGNLQPGRVAFLVCESELKSRGSVARRNLAVPAMLERILEFAISDFPSALDDHVCYSVPFLSARQKTTQVFCAGIEC
jgi:hypothetical protein